MMNPVQWHNYIILDTQIVELQELKAPKTGL
jgi:hypothetical protein